MRPYFDPRWLVLLVVHTSGHDIMHLMQALDSLNKLYWMKYWLILLSLIVTLAIVVASLLLNPTDGTLPIRF